jgi:hypothetical protein
MRYLVLAAFVALLSACAEKAPSPLSTSAGPDDPTAPSADLPYRPVMAGTAWHGVGGQP